MPSATVGDESIAPPVTPVQIGEHNWVPQPAVAKAETALSYEPIYTTPFATAGDEYLIVSFVTPTQRGTPLPAFNAKISPFTAPMYTVPFATAGDDSRPL